LKTYYASTELTNDHKQLMKEIEQAILSLHQGNKPNPAQQSSNNTSSTRTPHVASEPFARVNAVAPDSAAKEAVSDIHCVGSGIILFKKN
jgi:hypothetical protein